MELSGLAPVDHQGEAQAVAGFGLLVDGGERGGASGRYIIDNHRR
jgi:hypothetical protein